LSGLVLVLVLGWKRKVIDDEDEDENDDDDEDAAIKGPPR
jgi:hypothetical protein